MSFSVSPLVLGHVFSGNPYILSKKQWIPDQVGNDMYVLYKKYQTVNRTLLNSTAKAEYTRFTLKSIRVNRCISIYK
jgi:hypothetical protein